VGDKLSIEFICFSSLLNSTGKVFYVNGVGNNKGKVSFSTSNNEGHFKPASRFNNNALRDMFFNGFDCLFNSFFVIGNREKNIEWSDIDIEIRFTCINSDINVLKCVCFDNKFTLVCEMRVLDPVDYSSMVLGVLCSAHVCYRSLNRGSQQSIELLYRKL